MLFRSEYTTKPISPILRMSDDSRTGGTIKSESVAIKLTAALMPWRGLVIDIEIISGARAARNISRDDANATQKA